MSSEYTYPIAGFDGPALTPNGVDPVIMLTPCPYAQWAMWNQRDIQNAALTSGSGWVRATCTHAAYWYYTATCDLMMLATAGCKTVSATMTCSTPAIMNYELNVRTTVNNINLFLNDGPYYSDPSVLTGNIVVPYWRYRLQCLLSAYSSIGVSVGDWCQLDFTITT